MHEFLTMQSSSLDVIATTNDDRVGQGESASFRVRPARLAFADLNPAAPKLTLQLGTHYGDLFPSSLPLFQCHISRLLTVRGTSLVVHQHSTTDPHFATFHQVCMVTGIFPLSTTCMLDCLYQAHGAGYIRVRCCRRHVLYHAVGLNAIHLWPRRWCSSASTSVNTMDNRSAGPSTLLVSW